jgi:hypothetical protein
MPMVVPKTFYEWLMILKANNLRCGPLEAYRDSRTNHALGRNTVGRIVYGFWDHQTNTGYVDVELAHSHATKPPADPITPAPAIPDGDKEWDL